MWIARDKNGRLHLYQSKPVKYIEYNFFGAPADYWQHTELPSEMFPEVRWEDAEPTEVELVIKKKI